MPHPIGRFISAHVYDSKLKTKHTITEPKSCIRFVNVADGKEVKKSGLSSQVRSPTYIISTNPTNV